MQRLISTLSLHLVKAIYAENYFENCSHPHYVRNALLRAT